MYYWTFEQNQQHKTKSKEYCIHIIKTGFCGGWEGEKNKVENKILRKIKSIITKIKIQ